MNLYNAAFLAVFLLFAIQTAISLFDRWLERHDERVLWEYRVDQMLHVETEDLEVE